jgi:hypothetical protein
MIYNINIIEAIIAINPNAEVTVDAEDYNQITWYNNTPVISKENIQAKQAELQADFDAKQYQRDRKIKYPTWQDQMDMMWHDKKDGTSTWQDAIQAVKDANPKP